MKKLEQAVEAECEIHATENQLRIRGRVTAEDTPPGVPHQPAPAKTLPELIESGEACPLKAVSKAYCSIAASFSGSLIAAVFVEAATD
jgi:hypothetical protein